MVAAEHIAPRIRDPQNAEAEVLTFFRFNEEVRVVVLLPPVCLGTPGSMHAHTPTPIPPPPPLTPQKEQVRVLFKANETKKAMKKGFSSGGNMASSRNLRGGRGRGGASSRNLIASDLS